MTEPAAIPPAPTAAAVLAVGDEIVLGQKLNTNSVWLADRLASLGVMTVEHDAVADDEPAIAEAVSRLARRAPLVLVTGGLGPTADDLTREGLARALGAELREDPAALASIEAALARRQRAMTPALRTQARAPAGARALRNDVGTAPGLHARLSHDGGVSDIVVLPGPPSEMRPMFEREVASVLAQGGGDAITTRLLHCCGVVESEAAEMLGGMLSRDRNPTVGITVGRAIVTLRIRHRGPRGQSAASLDQTERACRDAMGPYLFGAGDDTLASSLLGMLIDRAQTVTTAESCTGGLLTSMLTDIPGSSAAVLGGWITYTNDAKRRELSVPMDLIERVGAVSEEVARGMAEGALLVADADHALAITGVAGPGGGSEQKPVGTVYVARSTREAVGVSTEVRRFLFPGDRASVRERAALMALSMLRLRLLGAESTRLAWQQG